MKNLSYKILVFFIVFFGTVLFIIFPVKADSSVVHLSSDFVTHSNTNNWLVNSGNYKKSFNIPNTCFNPILIYSNNNQSRNDSPSVSVSNISIKNTLNNELFYADFIADILPILSGISYFNTGYFLLDSSTDYDISFKFTGNEYTHFSFSYDIFCNVDFDSPVFYFLNTFGSNSYQIPATNSGNSGNIWYVSGYNTSFSFENVTYDFGSALYMTLKSGYDLANKFIENFFLYSDNPNESPFSFSIYNLNYKAPSSSPLDLLNIEILESPISLDYNQDKVINFSFDFCDNYADIEHAYFSLCSFDDINNYCDNTLYSGVVTLKDSSIIGPQLCRGVRSYTIKKEDIANFDDSYFFSSYTNINDAVIPFSYYFLKH